MVNSGILFERGVRPINIDICHRGKFGTMRKASPASATGRRPEESCPSNNPCPLILLQHWQWANQSGPLKGEDRASIPKPNKVKRKALALDNLYCSAILRQLRETTSSLSPVEKQRLGPWRGLVRTAPHHTHQPQAGLTAMTWGGLEQTDPRPLSPPARMSVRTSALWSTTSYGANQMPALSVRCLSGSQAQRSVLQRT